MLRDSSQKAFIILAEIERMISDYSIKQRGKLTPNKVMELLKSEYAGSGLTYLGALLGESLSDSEGWGWLQWVVFHFNFGFSPNSHIIGETQSRNWIAIRHNQQELLNRVHTYTINDKDSLEEIYAPSVVGSLLSADLKTQEWLLDKWWIYHLPEASSGALHDRHVKCQSQKSDNSNIVCFGCDPTDAVHLMSCNDELEEKGICPATLDMLIDGNDRISAVKKYRNFSNLVKNRMAKEFPDISNQDAAISCNYYVRLPIFFHLENDKYMTEIFLAFHLQEVDLSRLVSLLNMLEPSLRLCVSLVNSQIAYSLANHVRSRSLGRLFHTVLRHDLKNLATGVELTVDSALKQLGKKTEVDTEKLKSKFLDVRAATQLSMMATELDVLWNTDNIYSTCVSAKSLCEDLTIASQFSSINRCDFIGDWDSNTQIPSVCSIVVANMLRNAIKPMNNHRIELELNILSKSIYFCCYSEIAISRDEIKEYFISSLSSEPPHEHRGVWICRYVAEKLLGGEFFVREGHDDFNTAIVFQFPLKMLEAQ